MRTTALPLVSGGASFVGHARELREDRVAFLTRASREAPEAGRIRALGRDIFYTTSPAVVHDVFVDKARSFEKSPQLRVLLHLLGGDGLFLSEGDLWKRQRRLMAPLFSPTGILDYVRVVTEVVARAADGWKDGEVIDVGREMTRITMAIVGKALFNADAFDEADALGEALTVALDWYSGQLTSPWLALQLALQRALEGAEGRFSGRLGARFEAARSGALHALRAPLLLPAAYEPRMRKAIARVDQAIQAMIDERRAATSPPNDLLGRLLGARDERGATMSQRQVRDEAVTLFVAGHETTATALTWAVYLLGRAPVAWGSLVDEADRADRLGGAVAFRNPANLTYAINVFKETMRLYPPLYLLSRRAMESVTVGGYEMAKGEVVFTSPYTLHRRADVYPDPERFDPERFGPGAEAARPRSSYLPFGAGPRVCLGNHFAMMEGPTVLLALARRLSFEGVPGEVAPAGSTTLRPGRPILATVRHRARGRQAAD